MSFSELFPATTWSFRKLTSRRARITWLVIALVVLIPAAAFRLDAAFLARRISRCMSALSTLRVGGSSKQEALTTLAGVDLHPGRDFSACRSDECYSTTIRNSPLAEWILLYLERKHLEPLSLLASWCGLRPTQVDVGLEFTSGSVSDLEYRLMMALQGNRYSALSVSVASRQGRLGGGSDFILDESPDYRVYHHSKLPDLNISVRLTPEAPVSLSQHAFALDLRCLWSLLGCHSVKQLLPPAEQDQIAIEVAAHSRITGSDPCPRRILVLREKYAESISLIEVDKVEPTSIDGVPQRRATVRLLKTLRGKPDGHLDKIEQPAEIWDGNERANNPAFALLAPRQKLLLFSDPQSDNPWCQIFPADDEALQTVLDAVRGRN